MEEWYVTIGHLLKRPAMYGLNKVEDIKLLFLGVRLFCFNNSLLSNEFETGFNVFVNAFFTKEHNFKEPHDWSKLIRLYSGSDKHSLELFGRFFYEYLESIGISHSDVNIL